MEHREKTVKPNVVTSINNLLIRKSDNLSPHWIPMDSQSIISLFCNQKILSNSRKYKLDEEKRYYYNDGTQYTDHKGDLAGFGNVYYNPMSIANILSLSEVTKKRDIIYNSQNGNIFQ